jgi:Leucine-rich repeat (LRR) protein
MIPIQQAVPPQPTPPAAPEQYPVILRKIMAHQSDLIGKIGECIGDAKIALAFSLVCKTTHHEKYQKEIFGKRGSFINSRLQKMLDRGAIQLTGFLKNPAIQRSIHKLSLSFDGNLSRRGAMLQTIVQTFTQLQWLHIFEQEALPLNAIQALQTLPLKTFFYRATHIVDAKRNIFLDIDTRIDQIGNMASLEQLTINCPDLMDTNIASLARLPSLKELTITVSATVDFDVSLLPLSNMKTLEKIQFRGCTIPTRAPRSRLLDLVALKSLQELHLKGSEFHDIEAFKRARPDVRIIT